MGYYVISCCFSAAGYNPWYKHLIALLCSTVNKIWVYAFFRLFFLWLTFWYLTQFLHVSQGIEKFWPTFINTVASIPWTLFCADLPMSQHSISVRLMSGLWLDHCNTFKVFPLTRFQPRARPGLLVLHFLIIKFKCPTWRQICMSQ